MLYCTWRPSDLATGLLGQSVSYVCKCNKNKVLEPAIVGFVGSLTASSSTCLVLCLGLPRASGSQVINYPGNFLLPDRYPGSEYLICRIYLIGFSE